MDIEPSLKYFLTRPEPFICLLKGEWGVGKTYFVKDFVRRYHHSLAKQTFSYVSLFGIGSLEDLMQAIFLNSISTKMLDASVSDALSLSSADDVTTRLRYLFDRAKPVLSKAAGIPVAGANNLKSFVVSNAATLFNRNSLIVIDDLERHSASLPVRDILGVLTQLKEERNCQIIIVMNETVLREGSDAETYFRTKEKVIDREFTFEPTVDDAIKIGLASYDSDVLAAECCRKLEIANIRTVQKISSGLEQFRHALKEIGVKVPESFDQQLQSTMALAVWSYWERKISIDALENLELGDSTKLLMGEDIELSDEQQTLYGRVRAYGYSYSDDADKLIIRFVKSSVIDLDDLKRRVEENAEAQETRKRAEAIDQAWSLYNKTLKPNPNEVVSALYKSHLAGIEQVQIGILDGAVWVLRALGHSDKADDLIDKFFSRDNEVGKISNYPFVGMLNDSKFVERWKEFSKEDAPDDRDIENTIRSYCLREMDTETNLKRLSQFTSDEFYSFYKNSNDASVLTYAKSLMKIEFRHPNYMQFISIIEKNVGDALRRISAEDKINELRLRSLFPKAEPNE